jgi:hypothetical protein
MNTAIIEKLTAFFDAKPGIILAMPKGSALLHRHTMTALYSCGGFNTPTLASGYVDWYEDYYPIYKRGQTYILEHAFKRNLVGDVQ